nr:TPA_asm: adenain [Pimephales minnow adintovirus]
MNTLQLTAIMDKMTCKTNFLGVLPCDQLPKKPVRTLPTMAIVNTDPAGLPGEHWLAVYLPEQGPACFFDSFGNPPNSPRFPTTIEHFLATNHPQVLYSDRRVQDYSSNTCGQHCLFFLYHLAKGCDYDRVMKLYSEDYIKNDKMVSRFVKRLRPHVCDDKTLSCVQTCMIYK